MRSVDLEAETEEWRGTESEVVSPDPPYTLAIEQSYRILVVCTANQCRSPMFERLLARRLEAAGITAEVHSAGLLPGDMPAAAEAAAAMRAHNLDLTDHRSTQIDPALVVRADLVLAMTREHLREAVVLAPDTMHRVFTVKELARRATIEPRGPRPLDDWLRSLAADRDTADLLGSSDLDDVEDPMGRAPQAFRDTAAELDQLAARIVAAAWNVR